MMQVLLRPGLDQITRTQASFDFELERRVLSEGATGQGAAAAHAAPQVVDDPFQLVLERYMQMGYEVSAVGGAYILHPVAAALQQILSCAATILPCEFACVVMQREEVAMALAAHDGQEEQGQVLSVATVCSVHFSPIPKCLAFTLAGLSMCAICQVIEFCRQYRQLKSMGFAAPLVAGALMRHRNDLAAATESCLSAQGT
jgi:hypothetical protein